MLNMKVLRYGHIRLLIAVPEPKPVAQATKNTHLAFIRALLRAAEHDWKLLERAPNVKTPTPKNKRIRWLEPHEAQRLINECSDPLKSVVEFALSTGLRRSNIINLEWSQIDMQGGLPG
jgi:integrase